MMTEYGEYIDRLTFENIPFNVGSYDVFNRNFNDLSFTQFSYHYLSSDGDAVSDQYAINPNSTIPNILEVKEINGKWVRGNFQLDLINITGSLIRSHEEEVTFLEGTFYLKVKNP